MLTALVVLCVLLPATNGLEGMCTMIQGNGYACQEHFPETPDGFKLGLFRIPPTKKGAPAVLLQHGLIDCSATWVNNLPHESLGYILHDAGYDVWMSNSRGNAFSVTNTKYGNKTTEFWDLVDWDNMAKHDVPTNIDYVLQQTGRAKLSYVGHSQGTTQMFAALGSSTDPSIQDKIDVFIALAPVVYVNHQGVQLLNVLAKLHAGTLLQLLGDKSFPGTNKLIHDLGMICNEKPHGCDNFLLYLFGGDSTDLNGTRVDFYTNWEPSGTSTHNMIHWSQMVRNAKTFEMFDWGIIGNLKHYGQEHAPTYNVQNITTPIALFSGGKDKLADPTDVARLKPELHNVVFANYQPEYGHLDFVWGVNAHKTIYPDLLNVVKKYNPLD